MTDLDIHDLVRQLTDTHTHREPYEVRVNGTLYSRHHVVEVDALVYQLLDDSPGVTGTGDLAGTSASSRPTARVDAVDTVMLIDDEAGGWIERLGGVVPADLIGGRNLSTIAGSGTVLRLRRLHALEPAADSCGRDNLVAHLHLSTEPCGYADTNPHRKGDDGAWCCSRGRIQNDIRRWWYQARIVAGWDMAAWAPDNTCPVCDVRGKLRIRLDSALCIDCRTLWSAAELGVLAEHIRAENREEENLSSTEGPVQEADGTVACA